LLHCPSTPFLLVGTKIDEREDRETVDRLAKSNQKPITYADGERLAREIKAVEYLECSALTQVCITQRHISTGAALGDTPYPLA